MTSPANQLPPAELPEHNLLVELQKIGDALNRVDDVLGEGYLNPHRCAYIDGQLYKVAAWVASARAIVVLAAQASQEQADKSACALIADDIVISDAVRLIDRSGGGQ